MYIVYILNVNYAIKMGWIKGEEPAHVFDKRMLMHDLWLFDP